MPVAMLMKTTGLITPSALPTAPNEPSPSFGGLALQFLSNNVMFAFHQTFSWKKICLAINYVVTRCVKPLLNLGRLQGSPETALR